MKHFLSIILFILPLSLFAQQDKMKVIEFDIREEIAPSATRITSKALEEAVALDADLVLINMNTFGGLLQDADTIQRAIIKCPIPVWVYINDNAASAGALISIACDKIFMAPSGTIGSATVVDGSGNVAPDKYQSYMRGRMRAGAESHGKDTIVENGDTITNWKRDPQIAEAMVDPSIIVEGVVDSGKVLAFTPDEAMKNSYCEGIYTTLKELKEKEGIADAEFVKVTKSRTDKLIGYLSHPGVSGALISLIFLGIFFELRSPGVGFPLAAAIVAAIVYFAPLYIEGLAENWEILIFIVGMILIALELFVIPGFGVAGIAGITLILASLVLSLIRNVQFDFTFTESENVNQALIVVLAGLSGFILITVLFGRTILKSGSFNRLVLSHTLGEAKIQTRSGDTLDRFAGMQGTAHTDLRPMGKVRVNNELVDAKTYGTFISKGSDVKVVGKEYSYLIVIELEGSE